MMSRIFLTVPNEICSAYVKLNYKNILFVNMLWFSIYFSIKLRFIAKITSIALLPYTFPHHLWASHYGGFGTRSPLLFWDLSPTYLRILFEKKRKKINSTKIGKKMGWSSWRNLQGWVYIEVTATRYTVSATRYPYTLSAVRYTVVDYIRKVVSFC